MAMDEELGNDEAVQEMEKEKKSRDEVAMEISDVVADYNFLSSTIMQKIGNNEVAKALAIRMLASALVEKLAEVVAKEMDIDFTMYEDKKD
jgi:hypothetical protein